MTDAGGQNSEFYFIASIDNPVLRPEIFDAVRAAINVRCVMIEDGEMLDGAPDKARAIVSHIQSHDIAVLIKNSPDMAATLVADGVHLDRQQDFDARIAETLARMSGDAITGVEVDNSRHAAMTCAEKGADYLAFACPPDDMIDMIGWWAELFEIPSVAWRVTEPALARQCAKAGVDFIALDLGGIALGASPLDALAPFQAAIDTIEAAA